MTGEMEADKTDDDEEVDALTLALAKCYALARERAKQIREQRAAQAATQPPKASPTRQEQ